MIGRYSLNFFVFVNMYIFIHIHQYIDHMLYNLFQLFTP